MASLRAFQRLLSSSTAKNYRSSSIFLSQEAQSLKVTSSDGCISCRRYLSLQEYQSKQIMVNHDIAVQKFRVVSNVEDVPRLTQELYECTQANEFVIKAQILAGGKGKGHFDNGYQGGVKLTKDAAEVKNIVKNMLGHRLITKQTPPSGVLVNEVSIGEALDISKETYFAILLDREHNGPVMIGSPQGGMDIEQVALDDPEDIYTEAIDIMHGITDDQASRMAENLGFVGDAHTQATQQIMRLYDMFIDVDATQIEINPLGETPEGRVVCFDAKINFDDNAKFRQEEIYAMDNCSENDPREVEAASYNLNYIGLDGNIGCLVNGAGLAMATMDIVKLDGGEPANFLDCGGGVTEEQVFKAFTLLTHDKKVKAILVNIFGGIVDCATIAKGITGAAKDLDLKLPLIVRLEGTNVDGARKILKESGLPIINAEGFHDVARKAVASIQH